MGATHPTVEDQIVRADDLSSRLEQLLFEKPHTVRTDRDEICLAYWSLVLEHHRGILLLLHRKLYAPAYALIRPIAEGFLRLSVATNGTEAQLALLEKGTFNTGLQDIGEQIDKAYGLDPLFGPWFKRNAPILHGFTHGGLEQLMRRRNGRDIIPNYPDDEVLGVVKLTTIFACMTAVVATRFLGFTAENKIASSMFEEYMVTA